MPIQIRTDHSVKGVPQLLLVERSLHLVPFDPAVRAARRIMYCSRALCSSHTLARRSTQLPGISMKESVVVRHLSGVRAIFPTQDSKIQMTHILLAVATFKSRYDLYTKILMVHYSLPGEAIF